MNGVRPSPHGGSAPATPGFSAVAPECSVFYGAATAAPAIPAAESTLGSHPWVALSSAQVVPEWINRSLAVHVFAANGDPPLTFCLTAGVQFIYDLAENVGWGSVGVDHDTASFAVETIRRWWPALGQEKYPQARRVLIAADGGGSNGSGVRLWKLELQRLADETGIRMAVSHFPAGTSKWNKIEHRLFSFISKNWRGKPLTSLNVVVSLIAGTTTKKGLKVHAEMDDRRYPEGTKVDDQEMAQIPVRLHNHRSDIIMLDIPLECHALFWYEYRRIRMIRDDDGFQRNGQLTYLIGIREGSA